MGFLNNFKLRFRGVRVSRQSDVRTSRIGKGTRIWQFVVLGAKCTIGTDCNIGAHVYIEDGVIIGDRVTLKNGVQVWSGVTIGDDAFVGPGVCFTNAKHPRPGRQASELSETRVGSSSVIGANSTILPGIEIGENAFVAAGAVVTRSVPTGKRVAGNPAKLF